MNSWIRRAWKISRCLSVLGTHWHLSWLSRSWELRQLLLQHHTNSNMAISPFPSKPPVTFSATSIFYSSLHKPAPWGQWPRCGNALRPWHISSWSNQGWDTSFNLPFQRLQSGTSTDLGEYISECSKHPYTTVKDPEKDSLCIKECIWVNSVAQPFALEISGGASWSTGVAGAEITTNTGRRWPKAASVCFCVLHTEPGGSF